MDERLHPLTLTHARLRRAQGDVRGAIAIIEAMIDSGEEGDDLWRLYVTLGEETHKPHDEPRRSDEDPPLVAEAGQLAQVFRNALGTPGKDPRVDRLRRWLGRIQEEPD